MFTTLLESGRATRWRPAHPAHSLFSFAAHAAAIVTLAGASGPPAAPRDDPEERVAYVVPRFRVVAAEEGSPAARPARDAGARPAAPPRAVRLRAPQGVPDELPPEPAVNLAVLAVPIITDVMDDAVDLAQSAGAEAGAGVTAAVLAAARQKGYPPIKGSWADLFERGLVAFEENPTPQYPMALLAAGVEGAVLVAFVVDSTGRADVRTLKVVHSSDELFTRAVRRVLPRMRYRPAQSGATFVAVNVEQEFIFRIR